MNEILTKNDIVPFWKPYEIDGEFSQWYKSSMIIDGITYTTCEQYMMSQKALLFKDKEIYKKIMESDSPKEYKALGRKIKNFNEEIWNNNKRDIVFKANIAKFTQNKELKNKLLSTGNKILVEASPYDAIWGIKMTKDDSRILNKETWKGENLLGYILMDVREEIKNITCNEKLLNNCSLNCISCICKNCSNNTGCIGQGPCGCDG